MRRKRELLGRGESQYERREIVRSRLQGDPLREEMENDTLLVREERIKN